MKSTKLIAFVGSIALLFGMIAFAQTQIDLAKIPDGTYLGNYKATYKTKQGDYQAKVQFKVVN